MNKKDYIGKTFNNIVVLEDTSKRYKKGNVIVSALCPCGKKFDVLIADIKCGKARSCGCRYYDYIGKRFVNVEIVGVTDKKTRFKSPVVQVKCDCGKVFETDTHRLRHGTITSCGCKKISLGETINGIKIVSAAGYTSKRNKPTVNAICYCGTEFVVSIYDVVHGRTKSCGCLGRKMRVDRLSKLKGRLHPNYNHNMSDKERAGTRSLNGQPAFRDVVFLRDDFTCQKCFRRGGHMCAHHKNSWHWFKEGRTDPNNGITLCQKHHKEFHKIYGNKYNAAIQTDLYLMETYFPTAFI